MGNLSEILGCYVKRTAAGFDIELTKANVKYNVGGINNRDSRMILKHFLSHSPFPYIRRYAASVRIARC